MSIKKILSILATIALMATHVPAGHVAFADTGGTGGTTGITVTNGPNFDAGVASVTVNIQGGSAPYLLQVRKRASENDVSNQFGLNAYGSWIGGTSLPYTLDGSGAPQGVYWAVTSIFFTDRVAPFAIFDNGVNEFLDLEADEKYVKGYVDLEFTGASKNSTDFSYCLTSSVTTNAPTGGYPAGCVKNGTFSFGARVNVHGSFGDVSWNDVDAGTYYLTLTDGTNWVSNYETIEIIEPTTVSLNNQHVDAGVLDVTASISGGQGPYSLSFQDVFGNSVSSFSTGYTGISNSTVINDTINTQGIYQVKAIDSISILEYGSSGDDVSDSAWVPLAVYAEGSNGILEINDENTTFTTGNVTFDFVGAIKDAASASYCLDTAVNGNVASSYPTGCVKSGSINFGDVEAAYWSDLNAGTYYLTLTDGTSWVEPITLTLVDPVTFTISGSSSGYEVGAPLGVTITPAGGIPPYSVRMHKFENFAYSSSDVVTVATNIAATANELTYQPTTAGAYGFSVVDSTATSSQHGFGSSGDFGSFRVYPAGKVITTDLSDMTILVGASPNIPLNVDIKSGGWEYFYCLAPDAAIDDETGAVDNTANCVSSDTYTFNANIWDWTAPTSPALFQLTVQEVGTNNWSEPININVVELAATMNGFSDNTIEADVGDTVTITPNVPCNNNGCSYYIHTNDAVSGSVYTYSGIFDFGLSRSFDTSTWDAGTYYVQVVEEGSSTTTSGTNYVIILREPNSTTFGLSTVISGDNKVVKPFKEKVIEVSTVAVGEEKATLKWSEDVEATVGGSWNSDVVVTGTTTAAEVDEEVKANFKAGSTVSSVVVNTGNNGRVTLSDEVIIKIPIDVDSFEDINNLKVYVKDGAGTVEEIPACTVEFSGDDESNDSLTNKDNYDVAEGAACYVRGGGSLANLIYVATRHFSEFVVGEGEGEEEEGGAGGGFSNEALYGPSNAETDDELTKSVTTNTSDKFVPDEESVEEEKNFDVFISQTLVENRPVKVTEEEISGVEVFDDVANHWVKGVVTTLRKRGIIEGRDKGAFMPNAEMTRAEFVKVLVLTLGLGQEDSKVKAYNDSFPGAWYNGYLLTAKSAGLTNADGNTAFRPNDYINMAEAATLMNRAVNLGLAQNIGLKKGADLDFAVMGVLKGAWYYDGAKFVMGNQFVSNFKAWSAVSRAQGVNMIYKLSTK